MAELPAKRKYYQPWYNLSLRNLPLPGIVSIFHRISGILLFGLLFWLLWLLDRSLASPDGYAQAKSVVSHWFAKLVLLAIVWAYLHHFCAGIRYLFLDIHKGIELATARATSVAVFVVSLVLTLLVAWRFIW
jgi:succinate dehydrogenase / fumarate reductase, cytochrome b subunit